MALRARLVARIISENREATRAELEEIFQRTVLTTEVEPRRLAYFRDWELKRFIACELYYINVIKEGKRRATVIHHLSILLGRHPKALVRTIKGYFDYE